MVVATLQGQITLDAARTYSALELTAPINQQHMKAFSVIFAAQVDLVDGPLDRKKQDEASTRAVRHRWLAAANAHMIIEEEEIFPLEKCAQGDEMKRVSLLNKELRGMTGDPFPMTSAADLMQTRRKLATLFNDFALSQNEWVLE